MQCTIHRPKIFEGMLALWFDRVFQLTTSTKLRTRACHPLSPPSLKRRRYIIAKGAYPSPLGYCGFPKSICTSVNNVRALLLLSCLNAKLEFTASASGHLSRHSRWPHPAWWRRRQNRCQRVRSITHGIQTHITSCTQSITTRTPSPAARALVDCTHECMMNAIAGQTYWTLWLFASCLFVQPLV